jgi:microcystin-dependent protein
MSNVTYTFSPNTKARSSEVNQNFADLQSGAAWMTGGVIQWGGSGAPSGWLRCNGDAVSRTTYSALFAIIGTAYGVGDNSTTFNIPDCRSRMPIGSGQGSGLTDRTLGGSGGAETSAHTHTGPDHTHELFHTPAGNAGDWITAAGQQITTGSSRPNTTGPINTIDRDGVGAISTTYLTGTGGTGNTGSTAVAIMPPWIAFNFIIKI